MAELKPCPFCGGKPYLETRHRAFINGETTRVAFVRCTECEARTQRAVEGRLAARPVSEQVQTLPSF